MSAKYPDAYEVADQFKVASGLIHTGLLRINMNDAHICGRIRFYIDTLNGKTQLPVEKLAALMADDLKNHETTHAEAFRIFP